MSTTPQALIARAFEVLNVFQPGQTIPSAQAQSAFGFLNLMIGSWALQPGTITAITREVWPLVDGQGGPTTMYTYGPGGDFNASRAPNQGAFTGAGLLLGTSAFPNEVIVPLPFMTDDQWQGLQLPDLPNSQPTSVYYNPTYADGLGAIGLWPVPNTDENSLVLFRKQQIAQFTTLTQVVDIPEGGDLAIVSNLAEMLAEPFGREMPPTWAKIADTSLTTFKRANHKLTDLQVDPAFTRSWKGGYNINTGEGGGGTT